jgi:hypothetical protein
VYTPLLIPTRTKCPAHLILLVLTSGWCLVRNGDHKAPHSSWGKLWGGGNHHRKGLFQNSLPYILVVIMSVHLTSHVDIQSSGM